MKQSLLDKIRTSAEGIKDFLVDPDKIQDSFGHSPQELENFFGITKSDLLRLERNKLALKASFRVDKTGEHRTRWVLFKGVLDAKGT